MRTIFKSLLFALFLGLFSMGKAYALDVSSFLSSSVYENEKTGYTAYIDDEEDLLSSSEEERLAQKLIPLTEYGNVAFLSGRGENDAASNIRDFYKAVFYGKSGLIFFIDMGNKEIRIQSGGNFYIFLREKEIFTRRRPLPLARCRERWKDALLRLRCAGSVISSWQSSWDCSLTLPCFFYPGSRIKPVLGLYLEHFNPISRWRIERF